MSKKKIIILGVAVVVLIALFVLTKGNSNSPSDNTEETVTVNEETENIFGSIIEDESTELVSVTEASTREELITRLETVAKETTKFVVKIEDDEPEDTTRKDKETTTYKQEETLSQSPYYEVNEQKTTKKPSTTKVPTTKKPSTTKKPNNKIPTQKEKESLLGKSQTNFIKNMLVTNISGKQNKSAQNMAIYMANNDYSDVSKAADKLLGYNTLKMSSKNVTIYSNSTEMTDIEKVAEEAVIKLKGSYDNYGIGINTTFVGNKYKIYIVLVSK